MTLNLLIAPDFAPERFAGWHMLNTLLQKKSGIHIHLMTPASAAEQAELIASGKVDGVYANPFDAASMIRDSGYKAIARPIAKSDEMVIATGANAAYETARDLRPGCTIGLRLLEVADLKEADIKWNLVENYQAAARLAIKGEVDAAFFLAEAYNSLSGLTRKQMKVLVESKLADITHVFLLNSRISAEDSARFAQALLELKGTPDGQPVLDELGMSGGFEVMAEEDAEFMIDLMDTLLE